MSVTRDRINTFFRYNKRTGSQRREIKIQKKFSGICVEYFESAADHACNDTGIFPNVPARNRKLSGLPADRSGII